MQFTEIFVALKLKPIVNIETYSFPGMGTTVIFMSSYSGIVLCTAGDVLLVYSSHQQFSDNINFRALLICHQAAREKFGIMHR